MYYDVMRCFEKEIEEMYSQWFMVSKCAVASCSIEFLWLFVNFFMVSLSQLYLTKECDPGITHLFICYDQSCHTFTELCTVQFKQ